ncbi:MAG: hypothetical protein ACK5PT_09650, partial [Cereibacter sp.]
TDRRNARACTAASAPAPLCQGMVKARFGRSVGDRSGGVPPPDGKTSRTQGRSRIFGKGD